ncbi:DUF418 domain-containing protein [Bacillaceae bacterium SIJ1]|uniref:DUF418 domain-containing protein n=1 Tax=Litoribacterium kuwaitense TaxID=1398745 RepID=UPI0013EAB6A4|nr:DUF418 domain-containing protein [Litoribacterium kuwaitense]NGP45898.1 DUF418 domain-containing protein [Litoribacterium kuwaitense]
MSHNAKPNEGTAQLEPTKSAKRIASIDVLRGFALIGILLANMRAFKTPALHDMSAYVLGQTWPEGGMSGAIEAFLHWAVIGKFYPLFSFLFGLGFYLFVSRIEERQLDGSYYFKKRMAGLALIGLIHLFFIWSGDILHTYAVAGLFLLLFYRKPIGTLIRWGIGLLVFPALLTALLGLVTALTQNPEDVQGIIEMSLAPIVTIFQSGSYVDILQFRMSMEVPVLLFNLFFAVPNVLGVFLLGLAFGKWGGLQRPKEFATTWRRIQLYSGWSGAILSLVYVLLIYNVFPLPAGEGYAYGQSLNMIAGPLVMLWYVSTFVRVMENERMQTRLAPLGAMGRMALTNYIVQSIVSVFLFYGFGLGLFGRVSVAAGMGIAVTIFILQLLFSVLWLKKYNQGPLENLWRKATYAGATRYKQK